MDINHLRRELARRYARGAMIVATAGTTMTEAVDDVAAITVACDELGIRRRRIHVDAALSGVPLSLLPEADRPQFDFTAGATSMVVSGHKFLSTLTPCGVLIYAQPPYATGSVVAYTGSVDTTITGSRSGHAPLLLWWVLTKLGEDGLRRRAEDARALAIYTHGRLRDIGWPTGRNQHAFTVTLASPPPAVRAKWVLADDGQVAHIVCMPGVTRPQIDEFVADLSVSMRSVPPQRLGSVTALPQAAARYAA
jgi:histidine decarboxylase